MEEILASIRRIIADDQSRARLGTAKLVTLPTVPPEERQEASTASESPSEAKAVIAEIEARPEAAPPEADAPAADEASASAEVASEPTALRVADPANAAPFAPAPRIEAVEAAPSVEPPEEAGDGERHSESAGTRPEALELAPKLEEEVARLVRDSFGRDAANPEWRARSEPPKAAAEPRAEPSRSRQMPGAAAPEPQRDRSTIAETPFAWAASLGQARLRPDVAEPVSAVAAAPPSVSSRERGEAPRAARAEVRGRDPILSSETDLAVARAFNSLSRTVLSDNARTLEDLVTEMLRPLLKAWLDDNLPSLVERLVRQEIERVARGRAD